MKIMITRPVLIHYSQIVMIYKMSVANMEALHWLKFRALLFLFHWDKGYLQVVEVLMAAVAKV